MTTNVNQSLSITANEADIYVQSLTAMKMSDVSTAKWRRQHDFIEKLNVQAHLNVVEREGDEYVMESILSHGKFPILVTELLALELWRANIFPKIKENTLNQLPSPAYYSLIYHEATVANLLEIILYHESFCTEAGDALIDLADYCCRKLVILVETQPDSLAELSKKEVTIDSQFAMTEFQTCLCSLSILRYLTDHAKSIPLSVSSRLMNQFDALMNLVALIEAAPWARREKKILYKWVDGKWKEIPKGERQNVTKIEAQVWLAIYNLILGNEFRSRYQYNTFRKSTVLRLRPFVTETLIDQIPILIDLQRALDELAISNPPPPTAKTSLILEQIPAIRDGLISAVSSWEKLANDQAKLIRDGAQEAAKEEIERFSKLYSLERLDELLDEPKCACCGQKGVKRCSRCKLEWYCGRECQVKNWPNHKKVCDIIFNDNGNQTSK